MLSCVQQLCTVIHTHMWVVLTVDFSFGFECVFMPRFSILCHFRYLVYILYFLLVYFVFLACLFCCC